MVILIDRDILGSFCDALDVHTVSDGQLSALFFTKAGGCDFVYCTLQPNGDVRVELDEEARGLYQCYIDAALQRREGKERRRVVDEVAALIAVRQLLR